MAEKILIIDDDVDTLRLVGLMLQRQGYEIIAASNGSQGLTKALEERPDLILLDVMMPDMDGYEVTRRLRKSGPKERELLTIGGALLPLQYAIVDSLKDKLERVAKGHYRGELWQGAKAAVDKLVDETGDKVLIGVYRASHYAPPQVFYAHADHVHEAALVAIADSVLQEHRGFPMLIDLADRVCGMMFGGSTFGANTQLAYADAGEPFRYMGERSTRR